MGVKVELEVFLPDEGETQKLGAFLSQVLEPHQVIWLVGEMGAGKSTLVRAILQALGIKGRIKSPSFSLAESYASSLGMVYHIDLWRLSRPQSWEERGLGELIQEGALVFIEWPERALGFVPEPDWVIRLCFLGEGRGAGIAAASAKGERGLLALSSFLAASL